MLGQLSLYTHYNGAQLCREPKIRHARARSDYFGDPHNSCHVTRETNGGCDAGATRPSSAKADRPRAKDLEGLNNAGGHHTSHDDLGRQAHRRGTLQIIVLPQDGAPRSPHSRMENSSKFPPSLKKTYCQDRDYGNKSHGNPLALGSKVW